MRETVNQKYISDALHAFFGKKPTYCIPYGNGHINDTFLIVLQKRYILQRMNTAIFTKPYELMENILGITSHMLSKAAISGKDVSRCTLIVVPAIDGSSVYRDDDGRYWRAFEFVENTIAREKVESADDFEACGEAFGNFQQLLSDYPADSLHTTIENFHNTPWRFENLLKAEAKDAVGRAATVKAELDFAKQRAEFCRTLEDAYRNGELPLRVTHNDTKLNNILFDAATGAPVCVIDLDTVMPGYSVNDFGDAIRFGANTAAEDETDLSKVTLDLELFESFTKGFLRGCGSSLTETELHLLPVGAMMMTLECGMRFLTDYLDGDVYFKIHRENHNLDRARCQFALVADMERKLDEMKKIIQRSK